MASLTIKLPDKLKAQVAAEARLSGKSISTVVREAIEKRSSKTRSPKISLHDRAGDLCGIGDSGIPDLATNSGHLKGFGEWRG